MPGILEDKVLNRDLTGFGRSKLWQHNNVNTVGAVSVSQICLDLYCLQVPKVCLELVDAYVRYELLRSQLTESLVESHLQLFKCRQYIPLTQYSIQLTECVKSFLLAAYKCKMRTFNCLLARI